MKQHTGGRVLPTLIVMIAGLILAPTTRGNRRLVHCHRQPSTLASVRVLRGTIVPAREALTLPRKRASCERRSPGSREAPRMSENGEDPRPDWMKSIALGRFAPPWKERDESF